MAYTRYTNLREGFQGIISSRLNKDLVSLDFLKNHATAGQVPKDLVSVFITSSAKYHVWYTRPHA